MSQQVFDAVFSVSLQYFVFALYWICLSLIYKSFGGH